MCSDFGPFLKKNFRGIHSKSVSKLLFSGKFLKDDESVLSALVSSTSQVKSKVSVCLI